MVENQINQKKGGQLVEPRLPEFPIVLFEQSSKKMTAQKKLGRLKTPTLDFFTSPTTLLKKNCQKPQGPPHGVSTTVHLRMEQLLVESRLVEIIRCQLWI